MKKYLLSTLFIVVLLILKLKAQNTYWQQDVNYKINVTLNDTTHFLHGNIEITYKNNSPMALPFIYFHLWPNAYKNESTAFAQQQVNSGKTDFYFSNENDRGYIDSLFVLVNNVKARFYINEDSIDIAILKLNTPLQPNETIVITTPFRVKIPKTFSRLGHFKQQYQISQWFPKPAVFDKNGWHAMPYLDQGEFYSEYGNFDVHITLPKNYVVAATGDLQNANEINFLDSIAAQTATMDAFGSNDFPASSSQTKTLHYIANQVHDFAWFTDKRYQVLKGGVDLKNKHVNTWIMFTPKGGALWNDALPYVNNAITYYSKWVGDYPYNQVTAVEGKLEAGGGMEYPMVTVIGKATSKSTLETVLVHEVGHNWFQGILGTNERQHPWMDEGINSYYEQRYTKTISKSKIPKGTKAKAKINNISIGIPSDNLDDLSGNTIPYLGYAFSAWRNEDQPCELPADEYTQLNYFGDVYSKTPLLFNYLAQTISEPLFDSIMHLYFNTWKFKHPQPDDLKLIFNRHTTQSVDWFWDDAITSTKKFDLQLKKIHHQPETIGHDKFYKLTIKNNSTIRTPFTLSGFKGDSIVRTIQYGGYLGEMDVMFPYADYSKIKIDALNNIPEINRQNNTSRLIGAFRKTEPLKITPLALLKLSNKNQLGVLPVLGYNVYNGLMPGVLLYNPVLPGNGFNYQIAPMYSIKNNDFALTSNIVKHWRLNRTIANKFNTGAIINLFDEGTTTDAKGVKKTEKYALVKPYIDIYFKHKKQNGNTIDKLTFETYNYLSWNKGDKSSYNEFHKVITYIHEDKHVIYPQKLLTQIQNQSNNIKLTATYEMGIMYQSKKMFRARIFAGYVNNFNSALGYKLSMSSFNGGEDYLHQNMYLGRNESKGIWSKQIYIQEGGFRQLTWQQGPAIGKSNDLLGSINLTFDLPMHLPIALYADFGTYSIKAPFKYEYDKLLYDGGIIFKLNQLIQINLPIIASKDFMDNVNTQFAHNTKFDKWTKRITFVMNLNGVNPFKVVDNFGLN